METLRHWSVRHAGALARVYAGFARIAPRLGGALRLIGEARTERLVKPLERAAKQLFFDCQMCGQCVLSESGMACPTNCAKTMRNGPCGGVSAGGACEVKPSMRCVWVEATEGRKRISRGLPASTKTLQPIDQRLKNSSTWVGIIKGLPETAIQDTLESPLTPALSREGRGSPAVPVERAFPSPLAGEGTGVRGASNLVSSGGRQQHAFEKACLEAMDGRRFLTTVEIEPPDSPEPSVLLKRAARFSGLVDAINITDGAGGNCHMSSAAAAAVLAAQGLAPVCQIACRDRNRIAVQGDILGASALGVRNFLCITGDDVSRGDHPQAKPVFDLDSVSLLGIARTMRDQGQFASGRALDARPNLFLGATANPFVPPYRDRVLNLQQKIEAGAQFIQTQFCFDLALFEEFMAEVRARGLHSRAAIIVGVGTLKSAGALRRMSERVPGIRIPPEVIERIGRAADQKAEAKAVLVETIRVLRNIEGVSGIHLMGHRNETMLAEAIAESGARRSVTPNVSLKELRTVVPAKAGIHICAGEAGI